MNKDYHIMAAVLAADAFAIMINSAEQVFVSLCLFVNRITQKPVICCSQNSVEKFGAHGPRKKPLDFGGDPDMDPDPGIC